MNARMKFNKTIKVIYVKGILFVNNKQGHPGNII